MLKARHVPRLRPFVTKPTPAQQGSRDSASPQGLILNSAPGEAPGKRTVRLGQLSTTPAMVWMNQDMDFLWRLEECTFVQATRYSSAPNFWVLSILHRRNYPDQYQSCRGESFLLCQKLGQVEGHSRCFVFPSRAGEVKGVAEVGTDRSWESFGKEGFSSWSHACVELISTQVLVCTAADTSSDHRFAISTKTSF